MEFLQKVLWEEGMLLTPQHFQLAETYVEGRFIERFQTLFPNAWGICGITIDQESLNNGTFRLKDFKGIFEDGTIVQAPHSDPLPSSRDLAGKNLQQKEPLGVYLALPLESVEDPNCFLKNEQSPTRPVRYFRDTLLMNDFNTAEKKEEIQIVRKNLKIVFSDEELDGYTTIKISEIVRTPAGSLVLQHTFIPPLLWLEASSHLMQLVQSLKERMTSLTREYADQRQGVQDQGGMDLLRFGLLQSLFTCIPKLTHFLQQRKIHPEKLYEALIVFSGTLGLLDPKFHPHDLPVYDHKNLSDTFRKLEITLRQIISQTTPPSYTTYQLKHSDDCWEVKIEDTKFWEEGQFYVVAITEMAEEDVVSRITDQMKVAWPETIQVMISQAMNGIEFQHVLRPPSGIPISAGHYYFRLQTTGSFWEEICRAQALSIYLPPQPQPVTLELVALKE